MQFTFHVHFEHLSVTVMLRFMSRPSCWMAVGGLWCTQPSVVRTNRRLIREDDCSLLSTWMWNRYVFLAWSREAKMSLCQTQKYLWCDAMHTVENVLFNGISMTEMTVDPQNAVKSKRFPNSGPVMYSITTSIIIMFGSCSPFYRSRTRKLSSWPGRQMYCASALPDLSIWGGQINRSKTPHA